MRLDALLTRLGLGSRSEMQKLIRRGAVAVDGTPIRDPGAAVLPGAPLAVDGHPVDSRIERTVMLYKPDGVLTAARDPKAKTVMDLLPPVYTSIGCMPVGRLDKDTSGLLLLTNDGAFSHKVISPKSGIEKRYEARVDGVPNEDDVSAFALGLTLGDGTKCLPAKLEITGTDCCYVTVMEGKYHQVKRMLASRGKPVYSLRRLSVGGLRLDLKGPGDLRELTEEDLCKVFSKERLDK